MISKPVIMLVSLLGVCLLAISCGNVEEAQQSAESALLSLSDFPPGWTSSPAEEPGNLGVSEECKPLFSPGKVAKAESDQFFGPNDQVVGLTAVVFSSKEEARVSLNSLAERFGRCEEEFQDALVSVFAAPGVEATVTTPGLSFPGLGESSRARRTVVELQITPPRTSVTDTVTIQIGRMAGTFTYTSTGTLDADEELRLVSVFASKLNEAEEALPE